jgi:hypothetical protein
MKIQFELAVLRWWLVAAACALSFSCGYALALQNVPSCQTSGFGDGVGLQRGRRTESEDSREMVIRAFRESGATKEVHCYSWMYAEVFSKLRSKEHSIQLLEIGIDQTKS